MSLVSARGLVPAASTFALALALLCPGCSDEGATKSDATSNATSGDSGGDAAADTAGDDATGDPASDDVQGDASDATTAGPPSPAFAAGCPTAGHALVRELTSDSERFDGPASLAAKGDWMLANEHAAFVIKAPTQTEHTYAYYGGLLVDAVALEGCSQAAPERFGELPVLVGWIDASSISSSILRTFRGLSAEVLADGSDGKAAKLRVWGTDDWFWLVELDLMKQTFLNGKPRPRSGPLGVKLALDYTLEPGSAALRIDMVAFNDTATKRELHVGLASFMDDSTEQQVWTAGTLKLGSFGLKTSLPWITGSAQHGAIAISVDSTNLATAHFSGVDALIPVDQVGSPLQLGPKGSAGDSDSQTYWVSVGRNDSASAVAALEGLPVGGKTLTGVDASGVVREEGSGVVVPGARIDVLRKRNDGSYGTLVSGWADDKGAYAIRVPRVGAKGDLHLIARAPGRTSSPDIAVPEGEGPFADLELRLGPPGALGHDVRDGDDKPLPARLSLYSDTGERVELQFATAGQGSFPVPPGSYTLVATRGYHYEPWKGEVKVEVGKTTQVQIQLAKVIDTSGWMGFDGHVHSDPSPDSTVWLPDRYRNGAAEGLEVIGHTEHEILVDSEPARLASGVASWIRGVGGEEVTATLPEHTNMIGVKADPNHRRGAPVKWFGLDLQQIFDAERARGAGFVALNHPRKGCNWLCVIGYDRITLGPADIDPTVLGLPASATLWTWDFDAVELLNGMDDNVFLDAKHPERTGTFDDWMSFWNGGHFITGLAVTDVHGDDPPGAPRTYFAVPSDDLAKFEPSWLIDAVKAGRTMAGAGAFARVSIDGKGPGELVPGSAVKDGKVELKVKVEAISGIDVTRVLVLVNCDTALDLKTTAPDGVVKLDVKESLALTKDAHVVVVAFGSKPMPQSFEQVDPKRVPRVITNPIRVDVDGDGVWTPPGGKTCAYVAGG